jgi:fucose permease
VGSACLPWLTGFVSAERHSLRLGLAVPMIATMMMVTMSLALPLSLWSKQDSTMTDDDLRHALQRQDAST